MWLPAGTPLLRINQVDVAPYVQDDWRIIPSVTLSLGLRYEVQTSIHDKGDFAPRIGVAWGLGGDQGRLRQPKTVIRGGFGMFYDRFALDQSLTAERFNGIVQQRYVVQNPQFYIGSIPAPSQLAAGPLTTYRIDPGLVAPRIIQTAIGVDRQLPKNITLSVSYYNSRGVHELRTVNINAPLPGTYPGSPVYPMGNADPVYAYESSGLFKQSQLSANINARLNARYSMFGYYSLGNAHSNTDGVGTFPANTYDLTTEWGRAQFDIRHRGVMGGNVTAPFGLRLNPILAVRFCGSFQYRVESGCEWRHGKQRPSIAGNPRRCRRQQRRGGCGRASICVPDFLWSPERQTHAGRSSDPPQFRKWFRQSDHQHARQPDLGFWRVD